MNAFTQPNQSLASRLPQARILKSVPRNPRPSGFFVESGKAAQATRAKHLKLGKAGI